MNFTKKVLLTAVTSLALAVGFTGCEEAQTNDPLKPSGVELTNSVLSLNSTTLSGTITTKYTLSGGATLTNIVPSVSGCTIQSYSIGSNNTITYTDTNDVSSNVTMSFTTPCTATSMVITASEVNDQNITWPFSASASIQAPLPDAETSPIASITPDNTAYNITLNSQQVEIFLQVRGENFVPISEGNISVGYPGLNAGIMNPVQTVGVLNGVAKFVYTAPSDISALDGTTYTFTFTDTLNPLTTTSVDFTFNPDPTQIIQTEYFITSSIDDENVTMELNTTRTLTFFLKDKQDEPVKDQNISSMTIRLLNSAISDLIDSSGVVHDTIVTTDINNVTITLQSTNRSGLVPLEITFTFMDVNNVQKTITKIFSVVVLSGPPTAFTMSYAGTGQDETNAKFIEHIVVSAVDEYGNKVNRGSSISTGVISGYARDETNALGSGNEIGNQYAVSLTPIVNFAPVGTATIANSGSGAQLTSANIANTTIDFANDKLTTFRSDLYDYPFHASGKWDMLSVSGSTIDLEDDYNTSMPSESNMGYVIGHNFRQEVCSTTGRKALAYAASDTYKLDDNGNAVIDVYYDYYLVAKSIAIYVNVITHVNGIGVNDDTRGGETMVHALRGHGLEFVGASAVTFSDGVSTSPVTFSGIMIKDTPLFLRNSYFSYIIKTSGDIVVDSGSVVQSYDYIVGGNGFYGIYNCDNDGATFVSMTVTDSNPGNDQGGSVTFELINVIHGEF